MADITPSQAIVLEGRVQEIVLGQAVALVGSPMEITSGLAYLAEADDTAAAARFYGLAIETGALSATISILLHGRVDVGAVLTQGVLYFISETEAKMAPQADLTTGSNISLVGIAETTSILNIQPWPTGIVVP